MSVLDRFRDAEQELTARLRELRPLADEYRELEQIAQQRGLHINDGETTPSQTKPKSSPGRRRSRARSTGGSRSVAAPKATPASRSSNRERAATSAAAPAKRRPDGSRQVNRREDIVRLVRERPGMTISEIGSELKVDPTGLYRPVRQLQQEGMITKDGAKLTPTLDG